jgi:hypothetical protein
MARFRLLRELRKKGEGDTIDVDDVMFADDGMIRIIVFELLALSVLLRSIL